MASRASRSVLPFASILLVLALCLVCLGPGHELTHEDGGAESFCTACDLVGSEPPLAVRFEGPTFGACDRAPDEPHTTPVRTTRLVDAARGPPGAV